METETKTESLPSAEPSLSVLPEAVVVSAEPVPPAEVLEEKTAPDTEPSPALNRTETVEPETPADTETEGELVTITDVEAVDFCKTAYGAIQYEMAKVIVGQNQIVEEIVIALLTKGHVLLLGVPGLAKNLLVSTLAQVLDLNYKKVQFTADMTPSDVTGIEALTEGEEGEEKQLRFVPGPIFANVVLAEDLNLSPPKTQAALLEALQEQRVNAGGAIRDLPHPFFLLATQNPLEQERIYPLPESQLDRFMFMIHLDYPSEEEEFLLMKLGTGAPPEAPRTILNSDHIEAIQQSVRLLPVPDHVYKYAERVVRCTRPKTKDAFDFCKKWLNFGAGPRASLALIMAAKAHALIRGQVHVHCGNVAAVAPSILRHRLAPNFVAQSEGIKADDIIRKILEQIPRTDSLT